MTKFNEKSLHSFPLAFYYSAVQAFDDRTAAVETSLERFNTMKAETHRLFTVFDEAYKRSLKSQSTKTIADLDKVRDHLAYVIEKVAGIWAAKLDDDELNIHGRRVQQVFKDFDFRTHEALVAENAKLRNIRQQLTGDATLTADLAAMGLTELATRLWQTTAQIEQLMAQRNEEQSTIVVGELKAAREALNAQYRAFITYINAVQEIQPEEAISLAAQYYNQDLQKVELQLAQSRKGGSVNQKHASDGTTSTGTDSTSTGGSSSGSGDSGSSSGSGGSSGSSSSGTSGSGSSGGSSGDSGGDEGEN